VDDVSANLTVPKSLGDQRRPSDRIVDSCTEPRGADATGTMRSNRRENVAAVKRAADLRQPISRLVEHPGLASRLVEGKCEDAVVGPDERRPLCDDQQGSPVAPNARIYDGQVNGAVGKERASTAERVDGFVDVLGSDVMAQIYQLCVRRDAENDPFHDAHVRVKQPEVTRQGDDRHSLKQDFIISFLGRQPVTLV